jgi:hypothetical protein
MSYNAPTSSTPVPRYSATDASSVGVSKSLLIPKLNPPPSRADAFQPTAPAQNLGALPQDQVLTSRSFSELVRQVQNIQAQLDVLQAQQNLSHRHQITNPVQYLSQSGLGQVMSALFGGIKRFYSAKGEKTDAETDLMEDSYFEEVEVEKIFNVNRVQKTTGTQIQ